MKRNITNKYALYHSCENFEQAEQEIEWAVNAAATILNTVKEKWRGAGADDTMSRECIIEELASKL